MTFIRDFLKIGLCGGLYRSALIWFSHNYQPLEATLFRECCDEGVDVVQDFRLICAIDEVIGVGVEKRRPRSAWRPLALCLL